MKNFNIAAGVSPMTHVIKQAGKIALLASMTCAISLPVMAAQHPNLVINQQDVTAMKQAITQPGSFQNAFNTTQSNVDKGLAQPIEVPVPKDAGGGYTHEKHKSNYQQMYDTGIIYQLTGDKKYAEYVKDMLLQYATLYPTLPLHPMRKSNNEGKLFWQGLNEAVWLVHTIQAYDFIYDALTPAERNTIETGAIIPAALFLSEQSPHTFNKVHNHGTWATAAVGMSGYVLDKPLWVERALYDLNLAKKGGFMRQLDELFSPDGYYNEGPYYQRYALMPFVTFAKAIEQNEPQRKIFQYREGILLKAITSTVELSYNKLFFPLNDAIKSKGIDTIELVNGVAIAYGLNGDPRLLDIAQQQHNILLTGDGLKVAQGLDNKLQQPFPFVSTLFRDGQQGDDGALVVMRQGKATDQAIVFKATAQGLGHGHFDKLTWQFYDAGNEIVSDYGAARFLNVEAKFGGRYLPENESWAKQTIAHNTLIVDEKSHFNGKLKAANKNNPTLHFYSAKQDLTIASASIDTAYDDVAFKRTLALVNIKQRDAVIGIDIMRVTANKPHQYDLPVHYQGQLIDTNFDRQASLTQLSALGTENGYQHLWLLATANLAKDKAANKLAKVTWLNDNGHFYTHSTLVNTNFNNATNEQMLFTQLGANDPDMNLRQQQSFIHRVNATNHTYVSVMEPHGEYNPSKEYTLEATSNIAGLIHHQQAELEAVQIRFTDGQQYLLAINHADNAVTQETQSVISVNGVQYPFSGRAELLDIKEFK
ncbi:heparinase II/III family protein [Shewanella livingstonensis]|uniref:Alginate lyase n=3 Tax=Shewanella TaxID=22 RepID=A0A3G8LXQ2_9GAMM|nr:heparinase II/III family protein [Shewanella livingstonensis]AZG74411.1 alginate lyase [Shewanella livingstonensis]